MKENTKYAIILGVLFAIAVLIAAYFEQSVIKNPFVLLILLVFYLVLIISHFSVQVKEKD